MRKRTAILAIFTGGLIRAKYALLYAPRSGQETRQLPAEDSQYKINPATNSQLASLPVYAGPIRSDRNHECWAIISDL